MSAVGTGNIVHHGTVSANGGTYDIVTAWRINQPSIAGAGMSTFLQIFSIRQNSRRGRNDSATLRGTIDISAHFNAWEAQIPEQSITTGGRAYTASFSNAAELHEVKFLIEGFGGEQFSSGGGRVSQLCLRYGNNSVCTDNGCANCSDIPAPTPAPTPTPAPAPESTPEPAPEPTPAPTPSIIQPPPFIDRTPTLRFEIGSLNVTATHTGQAPPTLDVAPFIDPLTGRTMIPLRAIADGLGALIEWNPDTSTATFVRGEVSASVVIGEELPGGMGTAEIVDGRTFVPVRYVSEVLGAEITWDGAARAVYIFG
jgi:hypothetical protein